MSNFISILIISLFCLNPTIKTENNMNNKYVYCEYCGQRYPNIRTLTALSCVRHPQGSNKGKHKLYEGSEKEKYSCKYCGLQYNNLTTLTALSCARHPNGTNKGKHSPAL